MEPDNKKLIEFVCSANHGRSPVAELIAQDYIENHRIEGYGAISSGSRVEEIDQIKANQTPIPNKEAIWCIQKGLDRGLFLPRDANQLGVLVYLKDLTEEQQRLVQEKAQGLLGIFESEESFHRAEAIKLFGFRRLPKKVGEQTIVRPDSKLILGMARENADLVKRVYEGSGYNPVIDTLKGYATGESGAEFKNSFGSGSLQAYLTMVEEIRGYVHKSVDRLVGRA